MPNFNLQDAIIGIGLAVNAFFLRQLVMNLGRVDTGLAVLISKHEGTEKDVRRNENATKVNCKKISELKDNIHEIEIIINKNKG